MHQSSPTLSLVDDFSLQKYTSSVVNGDQLKIPVLLPFAPPSPSLLRLNPPNPSPMGPFFPLDAFARESEVRRYAKKKNTIPARTALTALFQAARKVLKNF